MPLRLWLILIILGCAGLNGCTKNGSPGPQGTQGPVGPAGAGGTIIFSGTTAPDPSVGNAGDFYLDLSTDVLFGPKNASGWGTGFAMKGTPGAAGATGATGAAGATGSTGATGATGAAGSQVYSGSGAPSDKLGKTGDYFLDKTNYVLYGPKLDKGWGTPITLQGPAGTANVEYSPWIQVSNVATDGVNLFWTDIMVPALSQTIKDQGTVLVYSDMAGYTSGQWLAGYDVQLPTTVVYQPSTDYWTTEFSANAIRVQVYNSTATYDINWLFVTNFRIILIPGGVSIPGEVSFEELLRYLRAKDLN